jgi:hypothetical protein
VGARFKEGVQMKRLLLASLLVLFGVSLANAEWMVDFRNTYVAEGIDKAVENALKDGQGPDAIVEEGVKIADLNPQNLIRALYCAGASGQDVRAAADKYQISEVVVAAGYKKSIDECGDRVADAQAFTPVATGPSFATPAGGASGSFASRAAF